MANTIIKVSKECEFDRREIRKDWNGYEMMTNNRCILIYIQTLQRELKLLIV